MMDLFIDIVKLDLKVDKTTGDLIETKELLNQLIISLFTQKQATPEELKLYGFDENKGWWADALNASNIGSKFWLLSRSKNTKTLSQKIESFTRDALEWMIAEKLILSIEVSVKKTNNSFYFIEINLYDLDNNLIRFTSNFDAVKTQLKITETTINYVME